MSEVAEYCKERILSETEGQLKIQTDSICGSESQDLQKLKADKNSRVENEGRPKVKKSNQKDLANSYILGIICLLQYGFC